MKFRFFFPLRAATVALAIAAAAVAIHPAHAQMQYPDQGGFGGPSGEAALSLRLSQLEEQVRNLNGQVEQMAHMIRQLESRLGGSSGGGNGSQGTGGGSGATQPRSDIGQQQFGTVPETGSGDGEFYGQVPTDGGQGDSELGTPPQILGQVPSRPLDLSGALDGSQGSGAPDQDGARSGSDGTQLAVALSGNPRDDYDLAYGHVLRGDFETAEASFRQFVSHYPDDELAGNAQYWLGESLFARGRYRDAADEFLAGYTEYPDNSKAPDNLFKLGMSLKELGQRDAACATLTEIDREYPNAPQAVRERARSEMDKSGC